MADATKNRPSLMDLVLASTSPYRLALLKRLGVSFRAEAPRIDEEALKDSTLGPRTLAESLARAKAASLGVVWPEATVIGGDQLVAFEGSLLGKPGTLAAAVEQLLMLSGRSHELVTALAVWQRGRIVTHTDITTLQMRPLDREAIARYVARDQPADCAGSYKLEEGGITLFERIESADHSAVTGLPLIALTTILRDLGCVIP